MSSGFDLGGWCEKEGSSSCSICEPSGRVATWETEAVEQSVENRDWRENMERIVLNNYINFPEKNIKMRLFRKASWNLCLSQWKNIVSIAKVTCEPRVAINNLYLGVSSADRHIEIDISCRVICKAFLHENVAWYERKGKENCNVRNTDTLECQAQTISHEEKYIAACFRVRTLIAFEL